MTAAAQDAAAGLRAPIEGALALIRHPQLWSLAWLPFVIGLLWAWSSFSAQALYAEGGWLSWLAGSGLMLVVVSLQFLLALLSPMLDTLSQRLEQALYPGHALPRENFAAGIARAMREGILLLLWKLGLLLVVSPLLLFEAGRWLWIPLSGFLIAVDFMDYPMSRRRLPLRQRRALLREHLPGVLVFSTLCHYMLLMPGWGGLTFLPAVLGGSWLVLTWLHGPAPRLIHTEEIDDAHTD